jgi:phosphoribosylformimino-5-aminoimidazole carboxamide ribotide isomerase
MHMKFRPCIDLHNGKVKQIVGGTLSDNPQQETVVNFETDARPSHFSQLYKKDALFGGHVIMLGPGNEAAARDALAAFPQGMHVGGGITTDNAQHYLDAGASHVIVTSFVFKDGQINYQNLNALTKAIGREQLVLDVSCRRRGDEYFIVTDRWQRFTDVILCKNTLHELAEYCAEFLIHAVDVEGKQNGCEQEVVAICGADSPIPVTYAGGIRSLADIDLIDRIGGGNVDFTVGSALDIFGGSLSYADVVKFHNRYNP